MGVCADCPAETTGQALRCPPCIAARKKAAGAAAYAADRDAIKARALAYQAAHPEQTNAKNAAWRAANPEKNAASHRKNKRKQYGVTNPTDETMSGPCYVSGCPYVGPLHFDHWHHGPKKGEFRGWLCRRCNMVAGSLRDDPALMRGLADYIELAAGVGWPEEST